jgi:hypothetical protein
VCDNRISIRTEMLLLLYFFTNIFSFSYIHIVNLFTFKTMMNQTKTHIPSIIKGKPQCESMRHIFLIEMKQKKKKFPYCDVQKIFSGQHIIKRSPMMLEFVPFDLFIVNTDRDIFGN